MSTAPLDLPAAPTRAPRPRVFEDVVIGMPHLDLAGLSEGWLFRHAGHAHWRAIHDELGIEAQGLRNDRGERLYASFVAVRARYDAPLSEMREDERLQTRVAMSPCGRSSAHSLVTLDAGTRSFHLEMASTFAAFAQEPDGTTRLRASTPSAALTSAWRPTASTPPLLQWAKDVRRGQPVDDPSWARALARSSAPLGRTRVQPSPYADYNHAGLLYFASFVTLAETAENALMNELFPALLPSGRERRRPWCLRASPVARDVLYHRNLPLGEAVVAELLAVEPDPGGVRTHLRLRAATSDAVLADLVTIKRTR